MNRPGLKPTALFTLVALALGAGPASAENRQPVGHNTPDRVDGHCQESGGVSFPKTGPDSTYGCMNKDGSGIVCGGVTADDKKTCSTFLKTPPRLPTRYETDRAAKAAMTKPVGKKP